MVKTIGRVLARQFTSSWKMLQQAIQFVSDDNWSKITENWSFAFNVFHIIETAEFYNRDTPKGMEWGKIMGIDWKNDSKDTISKKKREITKNQLLTYLKQVEKSINLILTNISDEDIQHTDDFDEGKLIILEKYLYLLKHTTFHIGELNKVLRDNKSQRIQWM